MVDAMRAMLDELMGKERDVPLEARTGRGITFTDPEICKYALAGLCPYGLFRNTKSDLGPCKYTVHDDVVQFDEAKAEYDALDESQKERYGYARELLALVDQLARDMDRKIERQKERAKQESAPRELTPADKERLDGLKAREKGLLEQSEKLAEEGDVDASLNLNQQAEGVKQQYDTLHAQLTAPERVMTVCDVCGVFINSTDNDQRRKDHLSGKQYLGWKAIRDKLAELQEKYGPAKRRPLEQQPSGDRDHASRDKEREKGGDRDRPRERSRSRDRHRRRSPPRRRSQSPGDRRRMRDGGIPPPPDLYERGGGGRRRDHDDRDRRRDRDREYRGRR